LSEADTLVFEGVGFGFSPGEPILAELDFRVPSGTVTAVIGLSGCGKSTVLRLAAGLLSPTKGRIQVASGRQAFVFQRPTLLPWRTVRQNVHLPLELVAHRANSADRVQDALRQVGLEDAGDKLPRALSGGMAMRVSLARALVTEPRVLLLDEPFSALDAFTRRLLYDQVLALQEKLGLTMLLVTHDVDEAALFAHQVLVLAGDPATVRARIDVGLPWPRTRALLRASELSQMARRLEEAV
jgi:NitT/TauT family transport system ATP-binding protein